jgi:predicted nucleic acid-binding Zn ribbon protein
MARGKKPRELTSLIGEMYRSIGMTEAYDQYRTLQVWNTVVGETIARVTSVEQLKDGDLYVRVKNPSWRMELNFRKKEIAERLNKEIGHDMVKMVIFR